jgi:hypothetical protein
MVSQLASHLSSSHFIIFPKGIGIVGLMVSERITQMGTKQTQNWVKPSIYKG